MSAHFMQTFHCSPAAIATETKPPQQLCYCWMAAKGVPGAGLERARWVEWLIRSKLLYENAHCYADKVVKEEVFVCHSRTAESVRL